LLFLWPLNQSRRRYSTFSWLYILSFGIQTRGSKEIYQGKLQYTFSLYGALVLFVKKKDGLLYICVNFHSLNYIFKKNHYTLLLISNLLDSLYKAQVCTKINLCYAYYLVCIADGNAYKTTFMTHYRLFKWFVIPFSLTNTPTVF